MSRRIRLDDDEPESTPRRRRRLVLDKDPPNQAVDGEVSLPRRFDNPSHGYFLLEENRNKAGRPKGSLNQFTRLFNEAMNIANTNAGHVTAKWLAKDGYEVSDNALANYLTWMALNEPSSYARLLAKRLPQVHHTSPDPDSALGQILEAARARLAMQRNKTIEARPMIPFARGSAFSSQPSTENRSQLAHDLRDRRDRSPEARKAPLKSAFLGLRRT